MTSMDYAARTDSSAARMIAALQRAGHAMTASQLALHGEIRRGDVAVRLRAARRAGIVVRRINAGKNGSREAVWALRGMPMLVGKTRPEDYKQRLGGRLTVGLAAGYDPRFQCGPGFRGEFSALRIGQYAGAAASCAARASE